MTTFEITLKGFDGRSDKTAHLVKWVNALDRATLDQWLDDNGLNEYLKPSCAPRNLNESGCVPEGTGKSDGVDFVIGGGGDPSIIDDWKFESDEFA